MSILEQQVRRHLPGGCWFHCLTDLPPGSFPATFIRQRRLEHGWPKWWSKIELFRPGLFPTGERVLYLDLDTVVVSDLEWAFEPSGFVALRDFYAGRAGFLHADSLQSSLMAWDAGSLHQVYLRFAVDPERAMASCLLDNGWDRGDQLWIERNGPKPAFWQDVAPGKAASYKVHCRSGLPTGASVVCFHGKPRPAEVADHWALRERKPLEFAL